MLSSDKKVVPRHSAKAAHDAVTNVSVGGERANGPEIVKALKPGVPAADPLGTQPDVLQLYHCLSSDVLACFGSLRHNAAFCGHAFKASSAVLGQAVLQPMDSRET